MWKGKFRQVSVIHLRVLWSLHCSEWPSDEVTWQSGKALSDITSLPVFRLLKAERKKNVSDQRIRNSFQK